MQENDYYFVKFKSNDKSSHQKKKKENEHEQGSAFFCVENRVFF